ncbi:hypothetical protein [Vitiosangium sp. GDMCC 1.1324]|uniref:hypothetical protein n=1 Tax=Vitiosangium sp. (strain GDMCC 1.1324) TaxID=2138576 RepID=UPI000D374A45|nr:hypothetical protein [Vitiosangium sp. GDMCC 1.1324]PTL76626.1 hypothetical protein DAT35_49000 [Vitiosangium sp. GDMCC 1.1324]
MERFTGGRTPMLASAAVGAVGLALTGVGFAVDTKRALFSYLFAFVYWAGLAVASLVLLGAWHASKARWPVVLRRMLETMAASLPLFVVLFIPILAGVGQLYLWMDPHPRQLVEKDLAKLDHKRPFLNLPFWVVRSAIYFAVWIVVGELLLRWSRRQDESRELKLTKWQWWLGAGTLPVVGLAMSFASLDWLMSLEPLFVSTVYGLYWFSGAFVGALAMLTLATVLARGPNLYGELVNDSHRASLGKFLLAFSIFWAYMAFSQFFLIWIANLPHEVPWYVLRARGPWEPVALFIVNARFVFPFIVLLSRPFKQHRRTLVAMAVWLLLAHVVDTWWLVVPVVSPDAMRVHWADATAFLGVGGAAVAFTLWRLRGHATVPVGDPYLHESLRYDE